MHRPRGGGTVFAVGKAGGCRQREVWHGHKVSQAASEPLRPRDLCSPTALTVLECPAGGTLRVSKRDATAWFDQLALPQHLRPFMGRSRVTTAELHAICDMSFAELRGCLEPG